MRGLAAKVAIVFWLCAGTAQAQEVRLGAPADCLLNAGCGVGLKSVYGLDVASALRPLTVADAGVSALDDGVAEVAVAFSSNPQLSRPDIMTLRDDRHMITDDHIVPVMRAAVLRRYGKALRRRMNAASQLLSTLELRGLN